MVSIKDLITENNVDNTYSEGKYIVFVLKNGIRVKMDPNEVGAGDIKTKVKEGK